MISVLVVDDEESVLVASKRYLERNREFAVTTARSASEGLELLGTTSFQAIVSDYLMPGMDGIAFLKRVYSQFGPIPFILFTGRGCEDVVISAINNGADYYLQKSGESGSPLGELAKTIRRVVGQRQADDAVRENERRLQHALEGAGEGLWDVHLPSGHAYFSPRYCSMLGYGVGEFPGTLEGWAALVHPEDREGARPDRPDRISPGRAGFEVEYRILAKEGGYRWILTRSRAVEWDERGHAVRVLGTHADVTDRKGLEDALREHESQLRRVTDNMVDMISAFDADGRFRYVSPSFEAVLGYPPGELLGTPALANLHPDEVEQIPEAIRGVLRTGEGSVRYRYRHRNGSYRWIESTGRHIYDRGGAIVESVLSSRDITERKMAEDALRQANRQLNLLTSITRHDILNMLTVILGRLAILEEEVSEPTAAKSLGALTTAARTIQTQIEFTRLYQDIGAHEPRWQDPADCIPRSAVPESIALTVDLPPVAIFADPMFERVFTNLLDNSMRHGRSVTAIRVHSVPSETGLTIVWEDDGDGIPAGEKERIFERGYGKNTGLGLFLVREILSLTEIAIRETGMEGCGARFEIVVPRGAVGWLEPDGAMRRAVPGSVGFGPELPSDAAI